MIWLWFLPFYSLPLHHRSNQFFKNLFLKCLLSPRHCDAELQHQGHSLSVKLR